ncbi:MAG: hypothetical protein ACKPCM_09825 [Pseudanabaena sp.]
MWIYTSPIDMPKNSYELMISAWSGLPTWSTIPCTFTDGSKQGEYAEWNIRFSTSERPYNVADRTDSKMVTLSPAEQAELDRVTQTGQAIANDPRLQQEIEKMMAQDEETYRRTGKKPNVEEILAMVERLRKQGILPPEDQVPTLNADLQRKLESANNTDYSHLRRFTDINHLKDEMNVSFNGGTFNVSWDLRRVNQR